MLLKDTSRTKNNQELVKASIDALVKALEAGHSEALSSLGRVGWSIDTMKRELDGATCAKTCNWL